MPYSHSTTFEGDAAACTEWLNYARGHLRTMLNIKAANNFQTLFPAPDVEIRIWTKPNRIHIKAGGKLAIAYPDTTQAVGVRSLFSTDGHWNIPPSGTAFGEDSFEIGDRYWVNKQGTEAVSWKDDTLYYRGVSVGMPFITAPSMGIRAAAVAAKGEFYVSIFSSTLLFYKVIIAKIGGVWGVQSYTLLDIASPDFNSSSTPIFSPDGTFAAVIGRRISGVVAITDNRVYVHRISLPQEEYTVARIAEWGPVLNEGYRNTYTLNGYLTVPDIVDGVLYGYVSGVIDTTAAPSASMSMDILSLDMVTGAVSITPSSYSLTTEDGVPTVISTVSLGQVQWYLGGYPPTWFIYDKSLEYIATPARSSIRTFFSGAPLYSSAVFSEVTEASLVRHTAYSWVGLSHENPGLPEEGSIVDDQFFLGYTSKIAIKALVDGIVATIASSTTAYNTADAAGPVARLDTSGNFSGDSYGPVLPGPVPPIAAAVSLYSVRLKNHLVVIIRDAQDPVSGDTYIKKTLVFKLSKSPRTATLINTLDYDIREYPSSTLGRISVTRYPKLK